MADDGSRIIDFGIAQATGATSLTTPGTVIGTLSFMSPEQVRADSATPESHVFSRACVLAYVVDGDDRVGAGGRGRARDRAVDTGTWQPPYPPRARLARNRQVRIAGGLGR